MKADPRIPTELSRSTFVRSLVMVPVRSIDPIGAIGAFWASRHVPTNREVSNLQILANAAGATLKERGPH